MIRSASLNDLSRVVDLAARLWPGHDRADLEQELGERLRSPEAAFFLYESDGDAIGFAFCALRRDYVEGTSSSPVGYLEGVYVMEPFRGQGRGGDLVHACEDWSRRRACREFASDVGIANETSQRFHNACGFREANRIVCYVKRL